MRMGLSERDPLEMSEDGIGLDTHLASVLELLDARNCRVKFCAVWG